MLKERIDILIVQKGLVESREKTRALIMSGQVFANGDKIDKPGTKVDVDSDIEIKENLKYVSRGGLKLEKAIETFGIDLKNKVCMDIGASTGGFTDCMLQNGASRVYAIDVGYGQFAWSLRQDSRVVTMERTNIRYVKPDDIGESCDFASIDVSFISLTKIFGSVKDLLKEDAEWVCLIKPQFEAGREKVGKKGVVRDKKTHIEVLDWVIQSAFLLGINLLGLDYSPIKGPKGNIEYIAHLTLVQTNTIDSTKIINTVVEAAHNALNT